ncbi:MAG: 2-dehydropantoate 2-reductase [Deltaproteobacteria bacterium]|nr:2-dehydropantoate 2-reductase [Deltaproteobacteria bacterium]
MRFLIVGPGAMGCLFSARLKMAGFDVTLLDYKRERAEELNRQGIIVEGISGKYNAMVPVIAGEITDRFDAILLCVKSYKTGEAGTALKKMLSSETIILTLQNGIGNIEILKDLFGEDMVLGGVTAEGATMLGSGRIRHAGQGTTVIGPEGRAQGLPERIASALNRAGFQSETTDNIERLLWGKLVINAGINALTAVARLKNGRLPVLTGTSLIMEELVREAEAVAAAKKILLPYEDPLARVTEVCRDTSGNISSMLQDILNKKPTEIDFINGAIVTEGEMMGIPTPANRMLANIVKAIEESYQEML